MNMPRIPGKDNYRVVISKYFDYDIFVQASDPEEAERLARQRYPDHRLLSVEKYNYWEPGVL